MDHALTAELKHFAAARGADLVGVAGIDRFEGVDAQHHPASIFPETRSIIVLGKRVTRGTLRGVEEGTQLGLYATYARNWVPHRFLASTTVAVGEFLEDRGWEAVPLPNLPPQLPPMGVAVKPGAPAPNVMLDFDHAAVRAGLGEIGLSGELMTPRFGHLQRLHVILTDATLASDALAKPQSVCDRCGSCARSCPLGAIDAGRMTNLVICGLSMPVAAIDHARCRRCRNGAFANDAHAKGLPDKQAAVCMRSCVQHMDQTGRLTVKFHQQFRARPTWVIDNTGTPRLAEDDA